MFINSAFLHSYFNFKSCTLILILKQTHEYLFLNMKWFSENEFLL